MKYSKLLIILQVVLLLAGLVSVAFFVYKPKPTDLGKQAVLLMYNFEKVEELEGQDEGLKGITTGSAYEYLTVTNSSRALNTYLKFNKKPVTVKILRNDYTSSGGEVLYQLDNIYISSNRTFLFTYDVVDGKIDNPVEYECINFKGSGDSTIHTDGKDDLE